MQNLGQLDRNSIIRDYYLKHEEFGKSYTVRHFLDMGLERSLTYRVLKRVSEGQPLGRKVGTGRIAKKMPKKKVAKLLKQMNHKIGSSQIKAARQFNVSQSYINNILKKSNLKYYKRKPIPKRDDAIKQRIKSRCTILRKHDFMPSKGYFLVMDDESYFSFNGDEFSGNRGFYSADKNHCPDNIRFKERQKWPSRVMMWIAISQDGRFSKPFFMEKGTMNGDMYLAECIKKRLVPFLAQCRPDSLFWADGATAHYKHCVTSFLQEKNIRFVAQRQNPPKVPELRPIEHFWALLKSHVYYNGWQAKSKRALVTRIKKQLPKVDVQVVQKMMLSVKTKMRRVSDYGIDSILK